MLLKRALARAAAIVPMVSLERCTAVLRLKEIKADGAGFRALGTDAVADGLLGIGYYKNNTATRGR